MTLFYMFFTSCHKMPFIADLNQFVRPVETITTAITISNPLCDPQYKNVFKTS